MVLESFFDVFLKKGTVFFSKKTLTLAYTPKTILHRDDQKRQLASMLAPALKGERPSNIFVYGKTGTGKTLTVKNITQDLEESAQVENIQIEVLYINCKLKGSADTEYRLIAKLSEELGEKLPPTGLPTEEIYRSFLRIIRKYQKTYIIILDEIDQLIEKVGDNVLYNLTRINEEEIESQISIIGISNNVVFLNNLDPRVRSSLSKEEIIFPPYNALQIQDILRQRANLSFNNDVLEQGVIEKCAAYAARDHGDARRALDLLRVAGEIADRKSSPKVVIDHIDEAEEKIDKDGVIEIIQMQPKQYHLVLYSILSLQTDKNNLFTGEVYEVYRSLCNRTNTSALTQRRVSDIISEFDMLGIVNAKVISKGRYGRTRDIVLEIPKQTLPRIKHILEDSIKV